MKNNFSFVYTLLLIIGDFLALIAAFTVAYIFRVKLDDRSLIQQIPAEAYLYAFIAVLPLWIMVHGLIGLYRREVYENRFAEFGKLIIGSILGILVVIGYDFVSNEELFPARLVVVYGLLLGFGFLVLFRSVARQLRYLMFSYNIGVTNVLIVGSGATARHIIEQLGDTGSSGYRIIGIVGKRDNENIPRFDTFSEAVKALDDLDSIVQTRLYADEKRNGEILSYAQTQHVSYRFIPSNGELFTGNIDVELFRGTPVVTIHQTALTGWGRIVKRLFDLGLSVILLILASPILTLVGLAVKLSDPRAPVFFRQTRLTRFNRKFRVYKFRSHLAKYSGMSPEKAFSRMGKPELVDKYRSNGDYLPDDPRVSRLGRVLRRTSLDELPQLFNVLSGDLSLVGPRALVPQELDAHDNKHAILSVKSGITGLAQVSGRKNISFEERRKLDIYYVQNWSFWLDIIILLKTFRAVLSGTGAK